MKQVVQSMFERGGGAHETEYRITRPDGSTRWIAGYGGVELDERGKPAFAREVSVNFAGFLIMEYHALPPMVRSSVTSAPALASPSGSRQRKNSGSFSMLRRTR